MVVDDCGGGSDCDYVFVWCIVGLCWMMVGVVGFDFVGSVVVVVFVCVDGIGDGVGYCVGCGVVGLCGWWCKCGGGVGYGRVVFW